MPDQSQKTSYVNIRECKTVSGISPLLSYDFFPFHCCQSKVPADLCSSKAILMQPGEFLE